MVGLDRKPSENLGMGHLPLSKKSFEGCARHIFPAIDGQG